MKEDRKELLACPGCGFKTIDSDIYGSYDICPICGWEDDNVQLANPCSRGGANRESLHEVQVEALKSVPLSTHEHRGFVRDRVWRPLSQEEVMRFGAEQEKQRWTNCGELDPAKVYWRL
jgi:hypothetical protein